MKAAAALLVAAALAGCSRASETLHVFNWDDYFAPDTLSRFEREAGCRVTLDTYESGQDLLAKLVAGGEGYDVCFPSDEILPALLDKGLLLELDLGRIPNAKHLSPERLGLPFDPTNAYTLPYFWGTTGIAYNREKVNSAPASWNDLWNEAHGRRVSILDDAREAIGAALRADGRSANEADPAALRQAQERLLRQKPLLLGYDSAPKERLISGEVWIAQCFSGDAIQARSAGAAIDYVVPREGASLWIDSMAIPKGARRADLAHRFIDYLLRPDVSAAIADHVGYANPNDAARALTRKEILEDPIVYPPPAVLERCEWLRPLPPAEKQRVEDLWAEVKLR
jgi:spermidine/putrescine-binding protein